MSRALWVYLREDLAGTLTQADDGQLSFAYAPDYLANRESVAISVSMPLREEQYTDTTARTYFSGLLPDERARRKLASALGLSEGNAFGILETIGGESAGALSLLPEGQQPTDFNDAPLTPLPEAKLIKTLELLRDRPLLGGELGVRLSLAGAQDKIAVCLLDGQIALAKGGRPTSHILKPAIVGLDGTVENEVFCMRLAARMGLPVPAVSKGRAGEISYFLVERYDRLPGQGNDVTRLHQEDFCQALGIPPELKYEEEGGPGIKASQRLIQNHARRPAADRLAFQKMVIFHYLVGNADAHAKNYALLYSNAVPDLAPLYDVVCTAAYPRLTKNMAMKLGGRNVPDTVQLQHWMAMVSETRSAQRLLTNELKSMASSVTIEADQLLKDMKDEDIDHPILSTICKIIDKRATMVMRLLETSGA